MAKVNILIIEDEIQFSRLLKRIYSNIFDGNVDIAFSPNFDSALVNIEEHAGEDKYDLISLDLMLTTEDLESYSGADCKTLIRKIHEYKSCNGLLVISGIAKVNSSNSEFNSLQSDIANFVKRYFPNNHMFFNKISPETTEAAILKRKEEIKKLIKAQVNSLYKYAFFRKGKNWILRSKAGDVPIKNSLGIRCIYELLLIQEYSPNNTSISAFDLHERCVYKKEKNTKSEITENEDSGDEIEDDINGYSYEEKCELMHDNKITTNEKTILKNKIYSLINQLKDLEESSANEYRMLISKGGIYDQLIQTYNELLPLEKEKKKVGELINMNKTNLENTVTEMKNIYSKIPENQNTIKIEFDKFIHSVKAIKRIVTDRTPKEKAYQCVSSAIKRAIIDIEKNDLDDLSEYFDAVIEIGTHDIIIKNTKRPKITFQLEE